MKALGLLTIIITPQTISRQNFQLSLYFQEYIENSEEEPKLHINMQEEIERYLTDNREYRQLQLEIKNFKIKHLPLGFISSITARLFPISYGGSAANNLNAHLSLSYIWETLFAFIYSPERQKALHQINQYRQEGAIQAREGLIKLARLISSIRKAAKQYLAIKQDLDKIISLQEILEANDLNDIFYLTEQLLSKEIELCELRNQLEELIYSNPIFYRGKVELVISLFKKLIDTMPDQDTINIVEYKIKTANINRAKISYFKSIFKKLPIYIALEGSLTPILFSPTNGFTWNWSMSLHPAEYIRYFLDIYFENQIISLDNNNRRQKIRNLMLIDQENRVFYEEQIIKNKALVSYTQKLLSNEDEMSKIKPKRILRLKLELIYKEEEVLLMIALLLLQNLVIFSE